MGNVMYTTYVPVGVLYAAEQYPNCDPRKLCPTGWKFRHAPGWRDSVTKPGTLTYTGIEWWYYYYYY